MSIPQSLEKNPDWFPGVGWVRVEDLPTPTHVYFICPRDGMTVQMTVGLMLEEFPDGAYMDTTRCEQFHHLYPHEPARFRQGVIPLTPRRLELLALATERAARLARAAATPPPSPF